uniref:NADH dehydrogenase subunit 2 n=1 Tax=Polylabroides guangdongensis TaxID=1131911 RepID=A0A3G0WYP9_9PLAT|nr:NADH dehydrogenase subunit 2 [Polylabroides guangdongensis]
MLNNSFIWLLSILLFLVGVLLNNSIEIIFFFEMITIIAIPLMIVYSGVSTHNNYTALMVFFVVSSITSVFLIYSWAIELFSLFFFVLMFKFGLFPFCWWVYVVYSGVSTGALIFLNTFFKSILLAIGFIEGVYLVDGFFFFFFFSILFCLYKLLNNIEGWYSFIAGNSIVSSGLLLIFLTSLSNNEFVMYFFLSWFYISSIMYFVLNINLFNKDYSVFDILSGACYLFVFLALPFSLVVIYKVYSVFLVLSSCGILLVVSWLCYNVIEQIWLLNVFFNSNEWSSLGEIYNSRLA